MIVTCRGLKSAEIVNLVGWLLTQCGSPETDCRQQCRKLFIQFSVLIPKIATATVWMRKTVESEGGLYFVSRFEAGGQGQHSIQKVPILKGVAFSRAEAVGWLESVTAALDCYNWVFKEQLFSPSELFDAKPKKSNEKPSNLFQSLEFFLSNLALHDIEAAVKCFDSTLSTVHTPREIEEYNRVKCSLVLQLLNFVSILLDKHPKQAFTHVPKSLWSEQLFKLASSCCMSPGSVGFSPGDVATLETLPKTVVGALKSFESNLKPDFKSSLIAVLSTELSPGSSCDLISQLPLDLHGDVHQIKDHARLDSTINGLLLLQKSSLLLPALTKACHSTDNLVSKLLESVFLTLRPLISQSKSSDNGSGGGMLSPANKHSTGLILELALQIGITPSQLVDCLLDTSTGCVGVGAMLYQFFPSLVNGHLLTEYEIFISHLVGSCNTKPEIVSAVLCGFLEYLSRDKLLKRKYGGKVCRCLLSQWSLLGSWWGETFDSDRRLAAVNILKKVLNLEPKVLVQTSTDPSHVQAVVSMYSILIKETKSSLAFKSKVFEVLHHFSSLTEDHLEQIKSSINVLIAKQFPLKSTEFPVGSPQYNEYISIIEKLLSAMVVSGSIMLLEVLVSIMCREKKHIHEEQIQTHLVNFMSELSTTTAKSAIDVAYGVFTNEQSYPPEARRAACERVCLTLLRSCSEQTLRDFFVDHIREIADVIEANLSKTAVESHLVSKLCCFQLIGVLYSRLPAGALNSADSTINKAYCKGVSKTGKELTQAVTKAGHAAKVEDLRGDKTHYELRRQYHCMAYNMVMSIISCTQQQAQFYFVFLFKEDPAKGQMLWDNLIDVNRQYRFETELETPMYRKKQMTAIRDKVRSQDSRESSPADSPPFPPRYLSSQYLADSSLSTDVSQFDFSGGTQVVPRIRVSSSPEPPEVSSYLVTEEQVEQDELNQHECMLPLMQLLDHMEHNKINPQVPKGTTPTEMPQWMASMHKKFNSGSTHQNVRLFLARLITNRPKVFQPYAKYWLPGLTQLVIGGNTGGVGIHYFIVDVVVTMLSWSTAAVLEDRHLASRLLQYLMEQAHCDNRSVFRNNLEIIKTLVECWKDNLQAPTKVIFSQFTQPGAETTKANRTGIQLLGVVVANGMAPYDPETAGFDLNEKKYYTSFVSLMAHKYKEVFAASAEVLGMVLAYMDEKKDSTLETLEEVIIERLSSLIAMSNEPDKFLACLQKLQSYYPKLAERFAEKLLFLLPKFHGLFKSMCLEVLQPLADIRPQLYLELKDKGFHNMLTFRDEPTQMASLSIVQGMVQHQTLTLEQTSTLLPLLTAFGSHPSQPCRLVMYDTLIAIYNNYSPSDSDEDSPSDDAKALLADVRDQLLQGLADDAESIRLKMYGFWNEESRLASDTLGRLTQLLAVLYSTNTERQFLYHSTNLLLELTSRSPDFTRSMFDSPLSECKFEDYTGIDLSWHQRHFQMTPLFAATQASQPGGTQMDQSLGSGMASGALRATQQAMAFTPTQEMGGGSSYNWMAPSLQSQDISFSVGTLDSPSQESTQSSSLLFNTSKMKPPKRPLRPVGENFGKTRLKPDDSTSQNPQEIQRREIMKLKRRFIRDRKITGEYYAKTQARKNIAREEIKRRQKAARDSQVVMYRKYRVGELPDIQIKHSELIRPFQALAQHDSALARMLFSILYEAVFVQVDTMLTDREAEETKKAIRDGLNMVMEKSVQFHPPFIGSLQDVCFREKQLELEPPAVSRACLTCMQEPIGIMLLEKQLLNNRDAGLGPRPAKRARGASAPLPEGTTAWVELARLYKSLGDFDSLCGIFSSQIGTKAITSDALEAEERGDYQRALQLYKEAISCETWEDGQPLPVEEDFWDETLLQCYSHLTQWQDLEKAALVNVDPPSLDSIWEDAYYIEHYLPHIMHCKLKLACSGLDDPNFSSFLDKALQDSKKRALLESEYCTELALYSIIKDDLDRARYYTGLCLQSFLQVWSNIDKLLVKSRATRLQDLQTLTEMQEYLDLTAKSTNFESTKAVDRLLNKWRSRFPHPKLDPISVWDDIVTSRCMMMRKILEHFHTIPAGAASSASESMEVDGEGGVNLSSLRQLFSREYTGLYLKMADTARVQNNYDVAMRYLQLTEAAIGEHFSSDIRLTLEWMHSVAEMKIQQAEQDPSPNKIEPLVALVDRLDGYNSQDILTADHKLARNHFSLQGRAFDQLAKGFSDQGDGDLVMGILKDSRLRELNRAIGLDPASTPTLDEVSHKLLIRCMGALKSGVKSGNAEHKATGDDEGMVKALVELASFCDEQLRLKEDEDIDSLLDTSSFPSVVVTYTLKAMQHGSKAATQQFPRLLQLVELYPETMDKFKSKCADVPNWMFITWISQLVALLDKEEGAAIHDTLISLAKDYPQALYYPLKISSCNFKFGSDAVGRANQDALSKLKSLLHSDLADDFVAALELLSSPELIFKDYCDNDLKPLMEATVPRRKVDQVKKIWRQFEAQLHGWDAGSSSSLYGESGGSVSIEVGARQRRFAKDFLKKIEEKFGKDGAKLHKMQPKEFTNFCSSLFEQMRPGLNKTTGPGLLKDYSPWLQNFQANQYSEAIEIPGQYDGKSKPLPEYHVKISGFDEKVLVMSSLRKPKRITIRGDDEREHMFLIKGGEDLRMDQRVEQVYGTMNDILDEDSACSQRELHLRTYQVIPMTPRVGLIEWMKNTKPLKDFLQDALADDQERKHYGNASKWQNDWLAKYGNTPPEKYKTMYRKAARTEVEKEYRRKVACVPWDLLRRAFMQLASSPEAFLTLRSHFIQTLATMSMCQYVLGIGDRHLSNFMLDMESGGMIGIDFGHAFGTATQFLPFPELIPFRMSPQITNLVLPHTASGKLKCCMVHTLRALRSSPRRLLNTMDVFVKEPSLDWKSYARKQIKIQRLSEESYSIEGVWYPKEKIRQAKKKLQGYNPAHVMLTELTLGHEKTAEYPALKIILMGDKKYSKRAQVGQKCSSVEEQVACLIDHATDPNILGRTWQGWEPWV